LDAQLFLATTWYHGLGSPLLYTGLTLNCDLDFQSVRPTDPGYFVHPLFPNDQKVGVSPHHCDTDLVRISCDGISRRKGGEE